MEKSASPSGQGFCVLPARVGTPRLGAHLRSSEQRLSQIGQVRELGAAGELEVLATASNLVELGADLADRGGCLTEGLGRAQDAGPLGHSRLELFAQLPQVQADLPVPDVA
jgi:hypothetical protein